MRNWILGLKSQKRVEEKARKCDQNWKTVRAKRTPTWISALFSNLDHESLNWQNHEIFRFRTPKGHTSLVRQSISLKGQSYEILEFFRLYKIKPWISVGLIGFTFFNFVVPGIYVYVYMYIYIYVYFLFLYMFLANQRFIIGIFSSVAPHRGQPTAKCHPWWQPTRRIAVSCGLGRHQIRTRDCRTTVWHATIEPPRLPIEPPRLPIEPPRLPIYIFVLILFQLKSLLSITVSRRNWTLKLIPRCGPSPQGSSPPDQILLFIPLSSRRCMR